MASEAPTQPTASAIASPHVGDISLPDADDVPAVILLDVNTSDSSDEVGSEEDDEDAPRVFTAGERVMQLNAIDKVPCLSLEDGRNTKCCEGHSANPLVRFPCTSKRQRQRSFHGAYATVYAVGE